MDRETFEVIKRKHGGYASWAIWADATGTPKSNIGDLSVLDPDENPGHCISVTETADREDRIGGMWLWPWR